MNRYCLPFAGTNLKDLQIHVCSHRRRIVYKILGRTTMAERTRRRVRGNGLWPAKWTSKMMYSNETQVSQAIRMNQIAACIEFVAGACVSELQRKHGSTRSNIQIEDEQATNLTHVANATQAAHAIPTATFPTFQKPASCLHPNFVQPSRCRTGEVARSNAK